MEDLGFVKRTLKIFTQISKNDAETFKNLMFGWRINNNGKYEENLFEKILMQSDSENLINLIWETFKLGQKEFVLYLVSWLF